MHPTSDASSSVSKGPERPEESSPHRPARLRSGVGLCGSCRTRPGLWQPQVGDGAASGFCRRAEVFIFRSSLDWKDAVGLIYFGLPVASQDVPIGRVTYGPDAELGQEGETSHQNFAHAKF